MSQNKVGRPVSKKTLYVRSLLEKDSTLTHKTARNLLRWKRITPSQFAQVKHQYLKKVA